MSDRHDPGRRRLIAGAAALTAATPVLLPKRAVSAMAAESEACGI